MKLQKKTRYVYVVRFLKNVLSKQGGRNVDFLNVSFTVPLLLSIAFFYDCFELHIPAYDLLNKRLSHCLRQLYGFEY